VRRFDAFAVAAPGLAPIVASELTGLGLVPQGQDNAGVSLETDARGLFLANLHLRTASRVLVRVDEFRAATFHELEKRTRRVDWSPWMAAGREVALRVTCRKSRLYHSGAVAERVAGVLMALGLSVGVVAGDGLEDAPPNGDGEQSPAAAQLLVVRLLNDRCSLSIDSSGSLLHQRGYRLATAKAPLRETLGAALLLASGWTPGTPLVDPFCGSGTLAIEGAMLARRMAPGRARSFAMEQWPLTSTRIPREVRDAARAREREGVGAPILASDRDAGAVDAARSNAARAGVAGDITFAVGAVSHLVPPGDGATMGTVVTNPPYGIRVQGGEDLRNLYASLGAVLRRGFGGWRVAMMAADRRLVGATGLRFTEALSASNGGIAVRFAVAEVPRSAPVPATDSQGTPSH